MEVHIGGQRFIVKSQETAVRVGQLAAYVNGKLQAIQKNTNIINSYDAALLAALNIASDLFLEKSRHLDTYERLAQRTQKILLELDSYLEQNKE